MFLINQNNRSNWSEWFKCPFDTGMMGACINSNKTYYKTLNELEEFGFIKYQKGKNNYKAPKISIVKLSEDFKIPSPEKDNPSTNNASVNITPLSTPLLTQLSTQVTTRLDTQLSTQLSTHKDILETSNFKLEIIIEEKPEIFNFRKSLIELGIESQVVSDWLKVRKTKKSANTETAFKKICTQIEKSGLSANACIKIATERSWAGFESEWIKNILNERNQANNQTNGRNYSLRK
jgi:DNA-binding transcriptional regulator YhcF (GntR family)